MILRHGTEATRAGHALPAGTGLCVEDRGEPAIWACARVSLNRGALERRPSSRCAQRGWSAFRHPSLYPRRPRGARVARATKPAKESPMPRIIVTTDSSQLPENASVLLDELRGGVAGAQVHRVHALVEPHGGVLGQLG